MKKIIAILLLFSLSIPSLVSAQDLSAGLSSVERIQQIITELNQISQERESYLNELENINNERKKEIEERLSELRQRESELKELKTQLELFGDLIDDQAIYFLNLNKKLTFWRIISGILGVAFITNLIIQGVSK